MMNQRIIFGSMLVGIFMTVIITAAVLDLDWPPFDTDQPSSDIHMTAVAAGDFSLTILVPTSFGRKYFTKTAYIDHPYLISRHEITIAQWKRCVDSGGCRAQPKQKSYQTGDHPVTRVSWIDAYSFTQWLSSKTGDTYRLPTEEEWAYAAFAGNDVTQNTIEDLIAQRQMIQIATMSRFRKTNVVGANGENEWRIADVTGPVWEWTLTCWFSSDEENKKPRSISELSDPGLCANRIAQGDERAHIPYFVDKVYSGGCGTGGAIDHIGFRVVKEV